MSEHKRPLINVSVRNDFVGELTPHVFESGALDRPQGPNRENQGNGSFQIAPWLPVVWQDTVSNDWFVLSTGKAVCLSNDGFVVPAGLKETFELTYTSNGLVNNDTISGTLTVAANELSSVGTYQINNNLSAGSNYTLIYIQDYLTITPAPLTVTAEPKTKVYGQQNPQLTYTSNGLVNNDTISGSLTTTATTFSPVGSYPINGTNLTASNNYILTYIPAFLVITYAQSVQVDNFIFESINNQKIFSIKNNNRLILNYVNNMTVGLEPNKRIDLMITLLKAINYS